MPTVDLTTSERESLAQAIQSAYFNQSELEQLMFFGLGERLDDVAAPGTLPARVMALVQWAEASGRTDETVRVAHDRRPGNSKLRTFMQRYLASAQRQVTHDVLERLTDSAIRLRNPILWRDQMARAESCVCRVLINGSPAGSGFLAGPGLVITNYHVVEHARGAPIQVEFGHRTGANGAMESGQRYDVTGAALFERPYSAIDSQHPKTALPTLDELDIVVLPVGGEPELSPVDGRPRGTIAPAATPRLSPGELVSIIQYPLGERLQFAYDRVLEINVNQTRVTYKVQTQNGSSGSPCFDADWNVVAVHHSGDPRTGMQLGEYNEGIPIATIWGSLPPDVASKLRWGEPPPSLMPPPPGAESRSEPRPPGATTSRRNRRRPRVHRSSILFLAANPNSTSELALGKECAAIQRVLRGASHRDFDLQSRWAVSIDDVMDHLNELSPTIIHFSGHGVGSKPEPERSSAVHRDIDVPGAGDGGGIYLQDEQGGPQLVTARALTMMIESAAATVRVVVLNACYSEAQAGALCSVVDCVIGMTGAIRDDAARAFAVGFYRALGNRRSVGNAVDQAVATLAAKQLPDEHLPRCPTRAGVDAHRLVLGAVAGRRSAI